MKPLPTRLEDYAEVRYALLLAINSEAFNFVGAWDHDDKREKIEEEINFEVDACPDCDVDCDQYFDIGDPSIHDDGCLIRICLERLQTLDRLCPEEALEGEHRRTARRYSS